MTENYVEVEVEAPHVNGNESQLIEIVLESFGISFTKSYAFSFAFPNKFYVMYDYPGEAIQAKIKEQLTTLFETHEMRDRIYIQLK